MTSFWRDTIRIKMCPESPCTTSVTYKQILPHQLTPAPFNFNQLTHIHKRSILIFLVSFYED